MFVLLSKCANNHHRLVAQYSFVRSVWTFRHALDHPPTPPGREQRSPHEKLDFQKLVKLDPYEPFLRKLVPVIFKKTVDGIAKAGEVKEINPHMLRIHYLPGGLADYASDYNVKKYTPLLQEQVEERELEPHEKYGITSNEYDLFIFTNATAIPVYVSLDNPWILQKWHIRCSLRLQDLKIADENIIMVSDDPLTGPNIKLQNKLLRFYISVNKKVVIPCIGRIQHVTPKTYQQMLMPTFDDPTLITKEQLVSCGLIEELPYVHPTQLEMSDKEILDLMTAKMNERKEFLEKHPEELMIKEQIAIDMEAKRIREELIADLCRRTFTFDKKTVVRKTLTPSESALRQTLKRKQKYGFFGADSLAWEQPIGKF